MVLPTNNKKVNLTYQVPMDYPAVFNQTIKNIENEKKNLHTLCSESEVRQNKALKLKNLNKPLWCGSCQAEQDPEYQGKYCDQCQKDPWYGSHKPWEQPEEKNKWYEDKATTKALNFMTFGAFEADYAEFQAFKEYMKFKNLSLQEKK
jgi:hypothetical protein